MLAETVIFLASDTGKSLIDRAFALANDRCEPARALSILRKTGINAEAANASWDIARLRTRAVGKLGAMAAGLIFDRDGYEMASSANCSNYHAGIMREWGVEHVVDLCGGIGFDALAFASSGIRVTVYEIDPGRAAMARCNAESSGLSQLVDVRCEDATTACFPQTASAAFFDPARRTDVGRRLLDPEALIPPRSFIKDLQRNGIEKVLAKLAPASERNLGTQYGGEIEFVSDGGECKEALLRLGGGRSSGKPSAVILPGPVVVRMEAWRPTAIEGRVGLSVYEPDPAVIRAGLVGEVASAVDGWLLDADVAYIMSDRQLDVPFASRFAVVDAFPFHIKRLQNALDDMGVGRVVIKKRAVPIEPEHLAKKLKLSGDREGVVIVTRSGKTQWCILCTRESGLVE